MEDVELGESLGTKKGNIQKTKVISLKQTERTKVSQTCIEMQLNLRRVTNLELNYLCQLLNVHRGNDVRGDRIYTAEPLVSELSSYN
jgi:hypothetical protein